MADRASDQVARLLGILARTTAAGSDGVTFEQLADEFGVPVATVVRDAELLWVSGTPGHGPQDLIDFDAFQYDEGRLVVQEDQRMGRALRLGTREAVVLVAALRALAEAGAPVLGEQAKGLIDSTLEVLTRATGAASAGVEVTLAADADPGVATAVAEALRTDRRLRITYVTGADKAREREVDPWAVLTGDERTYLLAWCHAAGDERHFRLDRVLRAEVLSEARTVAPPAEPTAPFRTAADAERVTLDLAQRARWVAEQLPVESVTDTDEGFRVELAVASDAWLQQLLLRLAADVRAVTPAGAAERAAAAARRALAHYGEN